VISQALVNWARERQIYALWTLYIEMKAVSVRPILKQQSHKSTCTYVGTNVCRSLLWQEYFCKTMNRWRKGSILPFDEIHSWNKCNDSTHLLWKGVSERLLKLPLELKKVATHPSNRLSNRKLSSLTTTTGIVHSYNNNNNNYTNYCALYCWVWLGT
jgi:hypothetical protein